VSPLHTAVYPVPLLKTNIANAIWPIRMNDPPPTPWATPVRFRLRTNRQVRVPTPARKDAVQDLHDLLRYEVWWPAPYPLCSRQPFSRVGRDVRFHCIRPSVWLESDAAGPDAHPYALEPANPQTRRGTSEPPGSGAAVAGHPVSSACGSGSETDGSKTKKKIPCPPSNNTDYRRQIKPTLGPPSARRSPQASPIRAMSRTAQTSTIHTGCRTETVPRARWGAHGPPTADADAMLPARRRNWAASDGPMMPRQTGPDRPVKNRAPKRPLLQGARRDRPSKGAPIGRGCAPNRSFGYKAPSADAPREAAEAIRRHEEAGRCDCPIRPTSPTPRPRSTTS